MFLVVGRRSYRPILWSDIANFLSLHPLFWNHSGCKSSYHDSQKQHTSHYSRKLPLRFQITMAGLLWLRSPGEDTLLLPMGIFGKKFTRIKSCNWMIAICLHIVPSLIPDYEIDCHIDRCNMRRCTINRASNVMHLIL